MKFEKINDNHAKFTFDVTSAEFEHGLDHAFENAQKDVEVKGFRKGHVPRNIYEQKFGVEALYEDAINHCINHKYNEVFSEKSVEIVSQPTLEIDFKNIKRGEDFTFSLVFAIKPEVKLGAYKNLTVIQDKKDVSEDDIENEVKLLLNENTVLEPKEDANLEIGDTAIFDFDGSVDGVQFEGGKAENYSLEIGSNQFIPGFEDQMVGLKVGDEKDVNVEFPKEYHAENLAGKPAVFKIKINEIKTKKEVALNDEFVKSLNKDQINTVEELKQDIKANLEKQKEAQAKNELIDQVLEQAIKNAQVDVPKEMIDAQIAQEKQKFEQQASQYNLDMNTFIQMYGLTPELFEQQLTEQANKIVLSSLVIEAVAKQENIKATDEQIKEYYDKLAENYKMPLEEIKKYVTDEQVSKDVCFQKAIDLMVESVIIKKPTTKKEPKAKTPKE